MTRSTFPLFAAALLATAPAIAGEIVPVARFNSVELRGGGNVVVVPGPTRRVTIIEGTSRFTRFRMDRRGQLKIDTCNNDCPRYYRLRIEIQSPDVPDLAVSGGGAITVQNGIRAQRQLSAAVSGGGRVDARAVEANEVSAAVNGGGELLVRARSSLAGAVNGGGLVRYWGNPRVSTAIRGGGAVRPGQ
jgi:hypothetical protein